MKDPGKKAAAPPASIAMAALVRKLKAEGRDVIDLTWGAPHRAPPQALLESVRSRVADPSQHSYGPGRGEPALRAAIAADLQRRRGLRFNPDTEILVVPGGKMGAYQALATLLEPGDDVLIPEPYWLSYPEMVSLMRARPVAVPSEAANRFVCRPEDLRKRQTARTRGLILNTPNNPAGFMLGEDDLAGWAPILTEMEFVLCDEVYESIAFGGRAHRSPLDRADLRDRCLLVNSFSKSLAVPGWRLGYLAGPRAWLDRILDLQLQTATCMPRFLQEAVAENLATCGAFLAESCLVYEQAAAFLMGHLDGRAGFHLHRPEGAFYALLRCDDVADGDELARRLLEERGVGTVPGSAYGESTRGWVRVCFAREQRELERAVAKLAVPFS